MTTKQLYTFDGLDEMYETAEALPDAERFDVYAHRPPESEDTADSGDWERLGYRNSLWLEDGAVGDVSSNHDFYHVHQYGDIVEGVASALEPHEDYVQPKGHVRLSNSGHKMAAYIDLDGVAAEPVDGDQIDMGLKVRSAHTGFHGLKYDVGAERQICSNGMVAFVSDLQFDQTHGEPLNYGLAQHAVDAIVDGTDVVEDRLQRATEYEFLSDEEAMLVLFDLGLDAYLDDPVDVAQDALEVEKDSGQDAPTLYDTYNAATRLVTHDASVTADERDYILEQAATLLDQHGALPDTADLGQTAVENRVDVHAQDGDETKMHWDDEEETLETLIEAYGDH